MKYDENSIRVLTQEELENSKLETMNLFFREMNKSIKC